MGVGAQATPDDCGKIDRPSYDGMVMVQILRAQRAVATEFGRYVGMMPTRWGILGAFVNADEISQARLEEYLAVDAAIITRQVKALEAEGLIMRRADPTDNRFTLVSLTEQGRLVQRRLAARGDTFEAQLREGLSAEEIEVLCRVLQRVRINAAEASRAAEQHGTSETRPIA